VLGLAGLAGAFVWGVTIPGEFLRAPLERALSAAFGAPTRIEGPLRVRTGLVATASADALVLADPLDPAAPPLARATSLRARIDLRALAGAAVTLDELTGERVEIRLERAADGRGNWEPIFASSGGSSAIAFGGIGRFAIGLIEGTYRAPGEEAPTRFEIKALAGALAQRAPATVRGTATLAGRAIQIELSTASLADLEQATGPIPIKAALELAGTRVDLTGTYAPAATTFDATFALSAERAEPTLAALGVAAREAGRLDGHGRLQVSPAGASVTDLSLHLGPSGVAGSARVAWDTARLQLALDLDAAEVDARPFAGRSSPTPGEYAAEGYVELLGQLATWADVEAKLGVKSLIGAPVAMSELHLNARAADRVLTVRASGDIQGIRLQATLNYDAREPKRVLNARVDGGKVSTRALRRAMLPEELSGTLGSVRGQLTGMGASARELVASMRGSLDASDLHVVWSVPGKRSFAARLDSARISVDGERTSVVELRGRLADERCAMSVAGGAFASLLAGARWPLRLHASCGAARVTADGQIAAGAAGVEADFSFDARTDRIGPLAGALGLPPSGRVPAAARGRLVVDGRVAQVKLGALSLGNTQGTGELTAPRTGDGAPRVQLAFKLFDADELATLLAGADEQAPADPRERVILPANLPLPDLDFDLAAASVRVAGDVLRRVHASGSARNGKLLATPYGVEWQGISVSGALGADLSTAQPRVSFSAVAQNADLAALAARFGLKNAALRADRVALGAAGAGVRLGDLLASASLDAAVDSGRFAHPDRLFPWLTREIDFSATLKAQPGQAVQLAARGNLEDTPFEAALDAAGLAALAGGEDAFPGTLQVTLGDAHLAVSGKLARNGTGALQVRVAGERVDRLGRLAGLRLPAVGPYTATGTIQLARDAIAASDLDLRIGGSRVVGQVETRLGGDKPLHTAALRAPVLRLEDLGPEIWLARDDQAKEADSQSARGREPTANELTAWLRGLLDEFQASVALQVDALYAAGDRVGSGHVAATLGAGDLHIKLDHAQAMGGSLTIDADLNANGAQPRVRVQALSQGFDFGPLARSLDPQTELGGRLDLALDLAAAGPPLQMLAAANGFIDLGVYPRGLRSSALDYWGTGMLYMLRTTLDASAEAQLNCAVAGYDVANGVARSRAFFADATRVRVVGEIDVNLASRALSGRLNPRAKNPELFSVAPTILLGGTLQDPTMRIAPESVVVAPLRFAAPVATFAFDWLTTKDPPADGSAQCRAAFERARRADPQPAPNAAGR